MMKRSFRLNVVVRVLVLLLALVGIVYSWQGDDYAACFVAFLVLAGGIMELIRYVERSSRDLSRFLLSIKHQDHTQRFTPDGRGKVFDRQREAQNAIMAEFQRLRADKEANHVYLQTVIKHVQVALLCVDEQGEVVLMNPAAKSLLAKPYLHSIQAMRAALPELTAQLEQLQSGQRALAKVVLKGEMAQLALVCTDFKLQDEPFRLISLQNIQAELEAQEFEAWQKLIRVLTHEIMNSVTPIISLATAAQEMVASGVEEEDVADLEASLEVISRRSKGMRHFVQAYRNLTRIPQPNFQSVDLSFLCQRVVRLMEPEARKEGVEIALTSVPNMVRKVDPELIEQVIINVIKNAIEALSGTNEAEITINLSQQEADQAHITIRDNGPGIPPEILSQIFIPFFTTKNQGSGIGLSLCRQIMRLHKGRISVQSTEGEGTSFLLLL